MEADVLVRGIGFLGVFVVPVAVYYLHRLPVRLLPIYGILVIVFLAGALELLGLFSVTFYMNIVELSIILLFAYMVVRKKGKLNCPGLIIIALFVVASIVSGLVNDIHILQVLLFVRRYIIPVLFLWYLFNTDFSEKEVQIVTALILALFLSQIPVSFGKFIMVGQTERYMGTMTIFGGSLTAAFSLFGVILFFGFFLIERKFRYLLAVAGFFLFAMIGEKRAVFVFAPVVILSMVYFSQQNISVLVRVKQISLGLVIAPALLYLAVIMNPTLNPEDRIGGSFDFDYLMDYTENYLFPDRVIRGSAYYGRGEAPIATWNLLTQEENRVQLFVGFGAGDLIMSRFIDVPHDNITRGEDLITYRYDIGYGGRTGLLWTLLQVGLTGTFLLFLFYFELFRRAVINSKRKGMPGHAAVIVTGLITLWLLDVITYSRVMITMFPVVLPFMWFLYLAIVHPDVAFRRKLFIRPFKLF